MRAMKTKDEDGDAHAGRKGRKWFCVEKKGKKEKKKKENGMCGLKSSQKYKEG